MCVTFFNYDDDTSHSILWIFRNISFWSDAAIQQVHNQKTQACFAAYVKHCLNGTPILIHRLALGFGDGTWDSLFKKFFIDMNTCWVQHLGMSPKCFTTTTAVLFSASEHSHCGCVQMTLTDWLELYTACFECHQSGYSTVELLCYMAGATLNCCHLSASSVYSIQPCTSLQCHFI